MKNNFILLAIYCLSLCLLSCDNEEAVKETLVEEDHAISALTISEDGHVFYFISNNKLKRFDLSKNSISDIDFDLSSIGIILDMWTGHEGNTLFFTSQKIDIANPANIVTAIDPQTGHSEILIDSIRGSSFWGSLFSPVLHTNNYIAFQKDTPAVPCQVYDLSLKEETTVGAVLGLQFSVDGSRLLTAYDNEKFIYHTDNNTLFDIDHEDPAELSKQFKERSSIYLYRESESEIALKNIISDEVLATFSLTIPENTFYDLNTMSALSPSGNYFSYVDFACAGTSCDFVVNVVDLSSNVLKVIAQGNMEEGIPLYMNFSNDEARVIYILGNRIVQKEANK